MNSKTSNFVIGMGIGSVIGAIVYRFSRTRKGRKLRHKMHATWQKAGDRAEKLADTVKEKAEELRGKAYGNAAEG